MQNISKFDKFKSLKRTRKTYSKALLKGKNVNEARIKNNLIANNFKEIKIKEFFRINKNSS
jgi:hypothetical protein